MQGGGFRDRAPEFEAADAVIVGASFDTVDDQKSFAEAESFPYRLISDTSQEIGAAYDVLRPDDDPYHGVPRRVSYLIDPQGTIVRSYDLAGHDLSEHAGEVLADIGELSD